MTNQKKKSKPNSNAFAVLGDIAKILAEALKEKTLLPAIVPAIVLIVLIAAVVTMFFRTEKIGLVFFVLCGLVIFGLFAALFIFRLQVRRQKEKIRTLGGSGLDMLDIDNTMNLVNRLNDSEKQDIRVILSKAAQDVAEALNLDRNLVRSNLFATENNRMRIIRELTYNMNRKEELTISMPVGIGSTGRCFKSGKSNIAIFRNRKGWGKNTIEDQELRKVHPDLKWIISVPIFVGGEEVRPILVLNVDGLEKRRSKGELENASKRLFRWREVVTLLLLSYNKQKEES